MEKIIVVEVNKETIHDLPEENIKGIFLPRTSFSSASVGIVNPKDCQKKHYHNRVDNGYEHIFVYSGEFVLMGWDEKETFNTNTNGPVFITVPSRTIAYIKNVGNTEVRFFSFFTPGLDITELNFIDE